MKNKITAFIQSMKINNRAFCLLLKRMPKFVIVRILNTIWNAITPYVGIIMSALIIDELSGNCDIDRLVKLVLISLGSGIIIGVVSALFSKVVATYSQLTYYRIEQILSDKMLEMDFLTIDNPKTQEMLSTIRQNQNSGGWGLVQVIKNYEDFISNLFVFLGGISLTLSLFSSKVSDEVPSLMFLNSPIVTIIVIILIVVVTFLPALLFIKADSIWAKNSKIHNLTNRLFGFYGFLGIDKNIAEDVRIYEQEKICKRYNTDKKDTFSSQGFFARLCKGKIGIITAIAMMGTVLLTLIVYTYVGLKGLAGAFGIGMITMYISSIVKVSSSLSGFTNSLGKMYNNGAFLKIVFEFLDLPKVMQSGNLKIIESCCNEQPLNKLEIEFKNVSFKYPSMDTYALKDVNLKLKPGKRLAVVGMNGSGTTTFIKLLCRLYDPTEGEILLNGKDIKEYDYQEYLNLFSVVFQDYSLLALKLGEVVGSSNVYNQKLVLECLENAGFRDKLIKLEKGLDTYLFKDYEENGINISGGEAQKIAIARTIYKNAPFMILDEPTAALDPIAEAEIYTKFDAITGNKTAIYISHRLSSCKFCDEIAVFHEGELKEIGAHQELLDKNNLYTKLWNAQAQYYN